MSTNIHPIARSKLERQLCWRDTL